MSEVAAAASAPAAAAAPAISIIGKESTAPFPIFDKIWEIFTGKGIRTVFVSIGNSSSSAADLDIAESLGCPVHPVPLTEKGVAEWTEVSECLKEKKREGLNAMHAFSEGAEKKWILPKNIRIQSSLPYWEKGGLQRSDEQQCRTVPVKDFVNTICKEIKLKEEDGRIDILKVDTTAEWPGLEKSLLAAILDAGYRPCLILVNWSEQPDIDLRTTLAAGHLQNAGYRLYAKLEKKFLYYYTDNDLYQLCSWEDTQVPNPLVAELIKQILPRQAGAAPAAAATAAPAAAAPTEVPVQEQKDSCDASA